MATKDPFAFLGKTKVPRETIMSLEGEPVSEDAEAPSNDPFAFLAPGGPPLLRFLEEPPPDLGIFGSFKEGVRSGVVAPFTFLGANSELDPRVDSKSEQISALLGTFVGYGISFIPFAAGTGIALRGVGLAATMSPELLAFTRNVIAGSLQFAGEGKTPEERKQRAVEGAVFGAAIEGGFLINRMIRGGRAGVAGEIVDDVVAGKEISLTPSEAKTPARMTTEILGLGQNNKSYDQVLADLTGEHLETVRVFGAGEDLAKYASERLPGAQVLQRSNEVLVHNPIDPAARLSPKQVGQWQVSGVFEGMEGIYKGRSYEFTGVPVAEGRVQLRDPFKKGVTFAPKRSEVTIPVEPKVFSESSNRVRVLQEALQESKDQIGFVVPIEGAEAGGMARRGRVDVSEYLRVGSGGLREFISTNLDAIGQIPGNSIEEQALTYAQRNGIKGLVAEEAGLPVKVIPFDQSTVEFVKEVPRFGLSFDNAVMGTTQEGRPFLQSFEPSWKNSVAGALRLKGIPEKEIQSFLDIHERSLGKRLEDLMDDDFKKAVATSRALFTDGCI